MFDYLNFDSSAYYYELSKDILNRSNNHEAYIKSCLGLYQAYYYLGDFERSEIYKKPQPYTAQNQTIRKQNPVGGFEILLRR